MAAIRKILLPTDFSGYSNRAFEHALAWATSFGADIHMLHIVTVHNFDPFNPELGFPEKVVEGPFGERVFRITEGNPYFVLEVAKQVVSENWSVDEEMDWQDLRQAVC